MWCASCGAAAVVKRSGGALASCVTPHPARRRTTSCCAFAERVSAAWPPAPAPRSLGVILYVMLSGRAPFCGRTDMETVQRIFVRAFGSTDLFLLSPTISSFFFLLLRIYSVTEQRPAPCFIPPPLRSRASWTRPPPPGRASPPRRKISSASSSRTTPRRASRRRRRSPIPGSTPPPTRPSAAGSSPAWNSSPSRSASASLASWCENNPVFYPPP